VRFGRVSSAVSSEAYEKLRLPSWLLTPKYQFHAVSGVEHQTKLRMIGGADMGVYAQAAMRTLALNSESLREFLAANEHEIAHLRAA